MPGHFGSYSFSLEPIVSCNDIGLYYVPRRVSKNIETQKFQTRRRLGPQLLKLYRLFTFPGFYQHPFSSHSLRFSMFN